MKRKQAFIYVILCSLILSSCNKREKYFTPQPSAAESSSSAVQTSETVFTTNLHLEENPVNISSEETGDNSITVIFKYPFETDLNPAQAARDLVTYLNNAEQTFYNYVSAVFEWRIDDASVVSVSFRPLKYRTPYTPDNVFIRTGNPELSGNAPVLRKQSITITSDKVPEKEFMHDSIRYVFNNLPKDIDTVHIDWQVGDKYIYYADIGDFQELDENRGIEKFDIPCNPDTGKVDFTVKIS